jgi:ADP-heptose:LPS heptosyltransferase
LGCAAERIEPAVHAPTNGASLALRRLADSGPLLVGIAPFGSNAGKRWPAEKVVQLIDALATTPGLTPVLLGGPDEREAALPVLSRTAGVVVDLVGKTTLLELCDLLRRCAVVVAVDSGPMHLAAAVGAPVVALFGGEDPRLWGPYGGGPHRVLRGRPELTAIEAPAVLAAVRELLSIAVGRAAPIAVVPRNGAREEVAA